MTEQEMRKQLIEKINQLYISFRKRYVLSIPGGSMFTPKKKGDLHSVLTNGVIGNHLDHKYAVAIYAGPKTSKFLCFDVDDGKSESVRAIIDYLECLKISRQQIYVSYSGGKGYHVELFFDDLVYTNVLRGLYDMVIEGTGLDSRKVEFRPTYGNAIKLPLSVHARTGNICWFVDRETLARIEREDYLLEIEQIPAAQINRIVPMEYSEHAKKASKIAKSGKSHGSDSVPDEEALREPGTRHNHMRKIAVYLRMNGHSRAQCQDALKAWYASQDQSLIHSDSQTVMADIENLLDWVFSERFKLAAPIQERQVFLTPTDARLVISAGNRTQRRILFLLLVRSISGEKAIALSEIGRIVGTSAKTVAGSIARLKESGKIVCVSGGRYQTPEGYYVNMRNQYTVPHYMGSKWDGKLAFTMHDVKRQFDENYIHCLSMLPEAELRKKLSSKEFSEYLGVHKCESAEEPYCIDQCASAHVLHHEEFGEFVMYEYKGNRLYPLVDVLKCMGIKNLDDAVRRHSARQIWYAMLGTRKVKKSFVDECYLALMLKRSRCPYKEKLIHW